MRSWVLPLLLLLVAGCPYMSKGRFEELWDADGDGWPLGEDCHSDNPQIYPYAPDWRGDGCDADCGREADADGDDWPDDADCGPNDPEIHPCSASETEGDGKDSDCDGLDGVRTGDCEYAGPDPDFPDGGTPRIDPADCAPPAEADEE